MHINLYLEWQLLKPRNSKKPSRLAAQQQCWWYACQVSTHFGGKSLIDHRIVDVWLRCMFVLLRMIVSLEVVVFLSLSALTGFSVLMHSVDFSRLIGLRAVQVHARGKHLKCTFRKGSLVCFNYVNQNGLFFYLSICDSIYLYKEVFPHDFLLKMLILHWWLWLTSVASLIRSQAGRREIWAASS